VQPRHNTLVLLKYLAGIHLGGEQPKVHTSCNSINEGIGEAKTSNIFKEDMVNSTKCIAHIQFYDHALFSSLVTGMSGFLPESLDLPSYH